MIPVAEALNILDSTLAPLKRSSERVILANSLGRVLSEDQISTLDLPPFNKSAMDGYAIGIGDDRDAYRVLGMIPAGSAPRERFAAGTCFKVMTGAPIPEGTGKVIMVEDTIEEQSTVRILRRRDQSNICEKGEDVSAGDRILPAGTRLDAADIANLVACGICSAKCVPRPKVAVLSTGNELVSSVDNIEPGKIIDTNGPLLESLALTFGMNVTRRGLVDDDAESTARWIESALDISDIVLASGGVSEGDFDTVCPALQALGATIHFSRVAMKPGKPTVFASLGEKVIFALPGNPVSVHLTFHLFVLRAVSILTSSVPLFRNFVLAMQCDWRRRNAERAQFVPCRLTHDGRIEPVVFHGSAHLAAISVTDGYAHVPAGVAEVREGEKVEFLAVKGLCK